MAANGKKYASLKQFKDFSDTIKSFDIDKVYPVGAVYFSMNSTDPGTLFGGTWSKIQGRFIMTSSSSYSAGDTGGSNDVVAISRSHSASTSSAGSSGTNKNMPAYIVLNAWERTA